MNFTHKVEFSKQIGRWVATYTHSWGTKGEHTLSSMYVAPDWAISRYGSSDPSLVDEVDEIFSLNFLFAVQSAEQQSPPTESPPQAASAAE